MNLSAFFFESTYVVSFEIILRFAPEYYTWNYFKDFLGTTETVEILNMTINHNHNISLHFCKTPHIY